MKLADVLGWTNDPAAAAYETLTADDDALVLVQGACAEAEAIGATKTTAPFFALAALRHPVVQRLIGAEKLPALRRELELIAARSEKAPFGTLPAHLKNRSAIRASLGDMLRALADDLPGFGAALAGKDLAIADVPYLAVIDRERIIAPRSDVRADEVEVHVLNDERTTFDCVEETLREHFEQSRAAAKWLTFATHAHGSARIGTYVRGDAESRIAAATTRARKQGFPLAFVMLRPARPDALTTARPA